MGERRTSSLSSRARITAGAGGDGVGEVEARRAGRGIGLSGLDQRPRDEVRGVGEPGEGRGGRHESEGGEEGKEGDHGYKTERLELGWVGLVKMRGMVVDGRSTAVEGERVLTRMT